MKRRVAVRGIVVYDNKLLCVKLKAYDGKDATEFWATPGGGVEPGEALVSALSRGVVGGAGVEAGVG
ncbi:NUDIX domain-containing protein, partial [Candidatus Saccharibacteria bacterium]|nr:NUDIX domain-containing protein [Candidatus Saccharibacteria bacterium]